MPDWQITPLSDGRFRLDGGTMFGIVPKVLWQRLAKPDALNRIALGLTCYLLRDGQHTVLVEAGIGPLAERHAAIYGVPEGPRLPDRLRDVGAVPEQVDFVLLSHLHLDHAGWCTVPAADGGANEFGPTFPRAQYVVQRGEYEAARRPVELERGSYWPQHFEPIARAGRWRLLEGDEEILPGLRAVVTGGHTPHHQVFLIQSAGGTACFLGDLVPTVHHLRLPYVMAYDMYPVELIERKKELLGRACEEDWRLLWYHDPDRAVTGVRRGEHGGFQAVL